jgi:hypothetical protein
MQGAKCKLLSRISVDFIMLFFIERPLLSRTDTVAIVLWVRTGWVAIVLSLRMGWLAIVRS